MFTNFSNMKGSCLEVGVCVYTNLIVRSVWGNRCFVFEIALHSNAQLIIIITLKYWYFVS